METSNYFSTNVYCTSEHQKRVLVWWLCVLTVLS